jgi:hypothetical protein
MRADLPKNREVGDIMRGVSGTIQELTASAAALMSQPLFFGTMVPALLRSPEIHVQAETPAEELAAWLDLAAKVQTSHRLTVAWYRSRLQGYPLLVAPQLAAGSIETTHDWSQQLPWTTDERRRGHQFAAAPAGVVPALGVQGRLAHQLDDAARRVVCALERTDEWSGFREAARALTRQDRTSLVDLSKHIAQRLSSTAEGMINAERDGRRGEYRTEVVIDAISNLHGAARDYADTFAQANDLIRFSATDIFGRLIMYDEPLELSVFNLDFRSGGAGNLSFEIDGSNWFHLEMGSIVYIDEPLIRDAIQIDAFETGLIPRVGERIPVRGRAISGTGDALRRR